MLPGNPGTPMDFGDNRGDVADHCLGAATNLETTADQALDLDPLIQANIATLVVDRCTPGNTGSGWAAINFTFGENTDIAAVAVGSIQIHKNGPIEKVQIR